jgi:hypothetical protein
MFDAHNERCPRMSFAQRLCTLLLVVPSIHATPLSDTHKQHTRRSNGDSGAIQVWVSPIQLGGNHYFSCLGAGPHHSRRTRRSRRHHHDMAKTLSPQWLLAMGRCSCLRLRPHSPLRYDTRPARGDGRPAGWRPTKYGCESYSGERGKTG